MNYKKDLPDDFEWPDDLFDFVNDDMLFYNAGYNLVKPIIDKHGEMGIECLIKNLPNALELTSLQKYQQRIFEKLLPESEK